MRNRKFILFFIIMAFFAVSLLPSFATTKTAEASSWWWYCGQPSAGGAKAWGCMTCTSDNHWCMLYYSPYSYPPLRCTGPYCYYTGQFCDCNTDTGWCGKTSAVNPDWYYYIHCNFIMSYCLCP